MAPTEQKKILYVCPSTGIGGAETFIKNTWLGHKNSRFSTVYLAFSHGPLTKWLSQEGAEVHYLKTQPRLSRPWTWWLVHNEIQSLIRSHSIDLVHSTMAYGALFTAMATRDLTPHVWFQHGPASGWMDQLAGTLPHSSLFTNSKYTTQNQLALEKKIHFLIPARRIREIDLGIAPRHIPMNEASRERGRLSALYRISEGSCIITMACRMQPWKGVHELIAAVKILNGLSELGAFHVLIWSDPSTDPHYFKELQEQARGLPISLCGASSDVRLSFAAADIVVNASIQPEPFGLTLIEGMSVGAVPVAPNWGGPATIIEHGKSGFLFEPKNPQALAAQLQHLIMNPEIRKTVAAQALRRFEEKYTLKAMMDLIEAEYDLLLK